MTLYFGVYLELGSGAWLEEKFGIRFETAVNFLRWCGSSTQFGGGKAIWGVRVAAKALVYFELY
jgi:hypothetical protein